MNGYADDLEPGNSRILAGPVDAHGMMSAGELLKSANALYWALTLLTLQQFGRVLLNNRQPIFDESALGDMQRQIEALVCAVLKPDRLAPRYAAKLIFGIALESAGLLRRILPGRESQTIWQEFHNKLQAFYLFEHVDSILGVGSGHGGFSLPTLVAKAAALGPYDSIWSVEGLGHIYANRNMQQDALPAGLLGPDAVRSLPQSSLLPLHTGMGLSLAEFLLKKTTSFQGAVDRFAEACESNSSPGYTEAAGEALGLVVRNLYPQLVIPIHAHLCRRNSEFVPYFWHGVGRAIYFSPLNLLPSRSAPWAGIKMCINEAPGQLARSNALAGFVWAMTLINIRHPEIIALFLQCHVILDCDAFSNGLYSAFVAWRDSAPSDQYLTAFCRYQPKSSVCTPAIWEKYVRQPGWSALQNYPMLSAARRIGRVFRY